MKVVVAIVAFLVLVILVSAVYVVSEPEQIIITRFGEPIGDPVTEPGLHFKVPFFDTVNRFDKRFLEWDGDPNEVPTKEKRFIHVDTYARWRITDPLLFFQRLATERGAQSRLDDILDGETRDAVASHNLAELVRTSNREPARDESAKEIEPEFPDIEYGRQQIRREILENAQTRTADLGIEILDLQFKRINYTEQVQRSVYERMIAERQRIAERFRSEGQGEALRIRGEKEKELERIHSDAFRRAEEIRGRADAEATEIYAGAYDRSGDSRRFYGFLKTMETYRQALDEESWLLLGTDGEFFRFLEDSGG